MNQTIKNQDLAEVWNTNTQTKNQLIQNIKTHNEANNINVMIREEDIAEEYYKSWLSIPMDNPMQRLVRHPLLTKQDSFAIQKYFNDEKQEQFKYGVLWTSLSMGIYSLFFSRMAKFQRFFNDRNKNRFINVTKKVLGTYSVFLLWMIVLNSHYQKKLPLQLKQLKLYQKYGIIYEQKHV